jgi:hypothetical protein
MTSAFYIATHALSVRAVLALMAPVDNSHWIISDPYMGLIPKWDVGQSAVVRMLSKTQVAGTALVIDAIVVLKMLLLKSLAPLLQNIYQANSLNGAEKPLHSLVFNVLVMPDGSWMTILLIWKLFYFHDVMLHLLN